MTSGLQKFLRTRRSIRRFKPDPIPKSLIDHILETATFAPSAHDKQPWRFVVVTTAESKTRLTKAITDKFHFDMTRAGAPEKEIQERIAKTVRRTNEAPVVVILCRDVTRVNAQPDEITQNVEIIMGRQSVAVAGLQLLLAAHAEGLGGTWICWPLFATTEICSALDISTNWEPQGMVFLGYPSEEPAAPERVPVREITKYL
jgi:coenzyme F420-0:L-glutamate ligase / coenzyme F420-1:gamma-L-glutamate ligase